MVVGALVMALSISCKSNEDPNSGDTKKEDQKTQERTFSYYAGDWWSNIAGTEKFITINADGSMVIYDSKGVGSNIPVSSTYIKKTSDISYTATVTAESGTSEQYIFTFSSDTQGTVTIYPDGSAPTPITKK
ncbi:hypothetical protein EPJ64_00255 [Brachyspira aalborgi]|nr:hypothetical protein [Brachyspira aalborgi]TXJ23087.1 hypothetical protein EPJ64_00255 [Brachyspira aalborgi]